MTSFWPNLRIYYLIAILACFIGFISYEKIYTVARLQQKKIIILFLFVCSIWNIEQAGHFIHQYCRNQSEKSWIDPENRYFHMSLRIPAHRSLFQGAYDPLIKNRLLNVQLQPIPTWDNEAFIKNLCMKNTQQVGNELQLSPSVFNSIDLPENYKPRKYLFCLSYYNKDLLNTRLDISGDHFPTRNFIPNNFTDKKQTLIIPINLNKPVQKPLSVVFRDPNKNVKALRYGLIRYNASILPIQVKSFLPYQAFFKNRKDGQYLEVFKEYWPGYLATVNGKKTPVFESPSHLIMIPLAPGINNITLNYVGLTPMHISFNISASAWLLLIAYFIFRRVYRKSNESYANI